MTTWVPMKTTVELRVTTIRGSFTTTNSIRTDIYPIAVAEAVSAATQHCLEAALTELEKQHD